ncbi:hypothetical protein S7711_01447 [Stachybotrys chartarum IBT 7711]|uniref:Uncharacterized protein n=1 Tax=Stachybotrys chartarum (strain CBS 109288 / IBT 7711) TaxID=1280523 RepID=A0A084B704_STACB|nr:hypothetical protein S7711_01447 [Stachybotrys chartarum IBT 7711]
MAPVDMKGDRYLEAGMAEPQCNDSTQLTEKHAGESTRSESPTRTPPACSRVRRFGLVLALIAVLGFTFDALSTGYSGLCRHGMYHMPGFTNTSDALAISPESHEELHDQTVEVVNFIGKRQDNESSTDGDGSSVPSDDAATTVSEVATTSTVVTSADDEVTSEPPPPPTTTSESESEESAEPTTSTSIVEETTTSTTRVPEETTTSANPPVSDTSSSEPEPEPETSTTTDPVSTTPNPVTSGTSITSEGPPPSTSSSSQNVAETTSTSQYPGDIYHVR